jgi:hypothetical protein
MKKQRSGFRVKDYCKVREMNIVARDKLLKLRHYHLLLRALLGCGFALILSACVYVPVVDEPDASASCKTYTKTMSLNTIEMQGNIVQPGCNTGDCAATLLAAVVVVSAGSAIISGSIVVTGNTLHWLEYQGTCSDGYLGKAKQLFLDSIGKGKSKSAETGEQGK